MPQIQDYTEHVTAQGGISAQASPGDFGAQIGQGDQQVGAGLEAVSGTAFRIEQDEGRIWAYDASSKAYTGLRESLRTKINALDPTDPGFTAKASALTDDFSKEIDQKTNDLMASAPSKSARKILQSHMSMNGRSLLNASINEQARISAEYTGKMVTDGLKSDQDAIAADPSDENYKRILANRSESIGGLQTVDPVAKMKWQEQVEHGLAITQVQSLAASNPRGFLASINAIGGHTTFRGVQKGGVPGGPSAAADAPAGAAGAPDTGNAVTSPVRSGAVDSQPLDGSGGFQAPAVLGPLKKQADLRGAAALTPAELAHSDSYDHTPSNIAELQRAIASEKNPASRAVLQTELDKINSTTAASYTGPGTPTDVKVASLDPSAGLPQVRPLTDTEVAQAKPTIAGWGKLTWQEKVAAVRQAEGAVGGDLAQARGAMDRDLRDASTSLLAGKSFDGLDDPRFGKDSLVRLYGPVDGPRKFDQLQYVRQVGGFVNQMSAMPVGQATATLANLAPQGGSEFADKQPVFHAATEAFQRLQKLRGDDFMDWALNNKVAGVQRVDMSTPEAFADSLHSRIAVAQSGVTDYGTDASLLSKPEVGNLQATLERMNPAQQMAYVKAIRYGTAGHDEWFNDVLGQIAPKNTTLAQAASIAVRFGSVKTAAGPQDADTVGQYVLEGAHILQGKDIDDPKHTGRPMALDDQKVRGMFWDAVGSDAFASLDAQRASQVAADTYQATKNYLAADLYHRGLNPTTITSDMVANAVTAVTGGTVKGPNGSRLFVPWGIDTDKFQREFLPRAQAAIESAGLKGSALDKLDAYKFVNVNDGKYGFMNGNKMLVGKDGRTVLVDYSHPFGPQSGYGKVQ